jgi:hypothetical protein
MIGSFASVFISSGLYILYTRTYELPSTAYPVPSAGIWSVLATQTSSLAELIFVFFLVTGSTSHASLTTALYLPEAQRP